MRVKRLRRSHHAHASRKTLQLLGVSTARPLRLLMLLLKLGQAVFKSHGSPGVLLLLLKLPTLVCRQLRLRVFARIMAGHAALTAGERLIHQLQARSGLLVLRL